MRTKPPDKPGWYWWTRNEDEYPQIMHVCHCNGLVVFVHGSDCPAPIESFCRINGGLWDGPIPYPNTEPPDSEET